MRSSANEHRDQQFMFQIEFQQPWLLVLLPLALLPFLHNKLDSHPFPLLSLIPEDNTGQRLHRAWQCAAATTIACLIFGLSGPQSADYPVERIGRGAEISVLLDRSASMDGEVRKPMPRDYQPTQVQQTKKGIAKEALDWLFNQRPQNRYSLTFFNVVPMKVAEFTSDSGVLEAALEGSVTGRGPKETNMGPALLAAIEGFENRPYTGSRALLLVSDGGAKLDEKTRQRIARGLSQNKVNLYFIYVQSGINAPDFDLVGTNASARSEEVELHVFFSGLGIDYQVFQADDTASMNNAVAVIDSQQNLPLTWFEQIPGVGYRWWFNLAALLSCIVFAIISLFRLERFA